MIQAKFTFSDSTIKLAVTGHAESAEYGKDVVCAGASTLAYTLGQVVTDLHKIHTFLLPPILLFESGKANVECIPSKESFHKVLAVYKVIETGFRMLENSYPEYVQVTKFDKDLNPFQ